MFCIIGFGQKNDSSIQIVKGAIVQTVSLWFWFESLKICVSNGRWIKEEFCWFARGKFMEWFLIALYDACLFSIFMISVLSLLL